MEELNEGERPKISFADNGYEEYAAVVEMELGELYYIVESAKAVYDWAILSDIWEEVRLFLMRKSERMKSTKQI